MQENTPSLNKKKSFSLFFVVVGAILLIGGIVFLLIRKKTLEEANERQRQKLEITYDKLDSISGQLSDKILTISQLGGEIDTLLSVKEKLESDKKYLRKRLSNQKIEIRSLNDRVDGYKDLLVKQDKEIERLKTINEQLVVENTELKVEKNQLNKSLRNLEETKSELSEKLAIASRLSIEGFRVIAINDKGKERDDGEYRNRHIDNLKFEFFITENEVAPIEGKEIYLKIIAPDGNVIFDITRGSGTFVFEKREQFFTAKQEIIYDRKRQKTTLYYKKGTEYAIGQHIVEIYTDDYLMGKGQFMIK